MGEFASPITYPTDENVSQIEVAAPPNVVWKYLIDFPRLDPPSEFIFKAVIAYTIEAKNRDAVLVRFASVYLQLEHMRVLNHVQHLAKQDYARQGS